MFFWDSKLWINCLLNSFSYLWKCGFVFNLCFLFDYCSVNVIVKFDVFVFWAGCLDMVTDRLPTEIREVHPVHSQLLTGSLTKTCDLDRGSCSRLAVYGWISVGRQSITISRLPALGLFFNYKRVLSKPATIVIAATTYRYYKIL